MNKDCLFLIGFMGAGKTSLGKELAKKYNYTFYDTDREIERIYGKTIEHLFEEQGEEYFRQLEAQTLRNIKPHGKTVIATGGGLPCFHNNLEWMNKNGITIYLKISEEELFGRLKKDLKNRPLLKFPGEKALKTKINELMNVRKSYYEGAKFEILSNSQSAQTIINTIHSEC